MSSSSIFNLIDWHVPVPVFTPTWTISTSARLTFIYVGSLYVSTATRIGQAKSKEGILLTKDDAVVVKSRLRIASVISLVAIGSTSEMIRRAAYPTQSIFFGTLASLRLIGIPLPIPSFLHNNGFPFQPSLTNFILNHLLPAVTLPLLLTSTLFAGPLLAAGLDGTLLGQRYTPSLKAALKEKVGNVWGIRNYLIGPLTEEIVFRGCIVSLHALAGLHKNILIFATPLYFGVAHLHHAYEGYVKGGRTKSALKRACLISTIQFAYTSMFGWYANFLFLRSNTLLAPLVSHIFCNIMGLPDPIEAVRIHPHRKWSIYGAYVAGIVGFAFSIMPLTKPSLFGGSLYWQ